MAVNDKGYMYSSAELKKVKYMQFGVLGPDELRRMSVVEVKYETAFEGGIPKPEGLMDQRMGAIGRDFPCDTCGCDETNCVGHFGHIELAKPVFHPGYLTVTLKLLRSVCFFCSKLLVREDDHRIKRAARLKKRASRMAVVSSIAEKKNKCDNCGNDQPKFSRDGLKFRLEFKEGADDFVEKKQQLSAEKVHTIFKHITDYDCDLFGLDRRLARPDWLVLTILPVPPPPVRPSIMMDATTRGEDDLTHKLGDIVKNNNALRTLESTGAPLHRVNEQVDLLQYHVATYMNNELPGLPRAEQKGGRPLKSIGQRLKGKEGRVRGNLMGKRVNFSGRTVITADPNLMLDEVGVPRSIAMNLTYPEVVTRFNFEKMKELVMNGPDAYPGAKYVIRNDETRIDLGYLKSRADFDLNIGMKVVRHIVDGDCVLFNRQPSLHKMSIMGHRVRVLPYSTFRLNLSVTSPYNADFDGDEMNMHVPQSPLTRAEVFELMMVPRCIVSPQSNRPVMGIVQDSLLACMLFTQRDAFFERDFTMNLLLHVNGWDGQVPIPAILHPKPLWTGKQLFSLILPSLNLVRFSNAHPDDENTDISPGDTKIIISGGELICGIVDKRTVGASAGSLIHVCWKEHGPQTTCKMISDIQVLVNHFILHRGFSIGIGDAIADDATMKQVIDTIQSSKDDVKALIQQAQEGDLTLLPGKTMMESFEAEVNKVLNGARDKSGSLAQKSLLPSNNVKRMVTAGSKGSFINISQICACVGQQNVEGKRIAYGFRRRTLPHFALDDLGPESRGFVENSYLRGLTPTEFFFHAMGGREGLIDTAVKTAETGYIQRRLIKAMEDLIVRYDGTVRNSVGDIVQFLYGEDGLDGCKVEGQALATLRLANKTFERWYRLDPSDSRFGLGENGSRYLSLKATDEIRKNDEVKSLLQEEFDQLSEDRKIMRAEIVRSGENKWPLPVNVDRLIWNAKSAFNISQDAVSDLDPSFIIKSVRALLERCVVVPKMKGKSGMDVEASVPDDLSIYLQPGEDIRKDQAILEERRDKAMDKVKQDVKERDIINRLAEQAQMNATLLFQIHIRSMLCSRQVLEEHRLNKTAFEWLLGEIETKFLQAKCNPGEMIGAVAAQSIGEPATQMTLNTFHFAGVSAKNVTLGVPRLKEIINVAKNPKTPSLTVYLKGWAAKDVERAKQVQAQLQHTTLRHVTQLTEIYYDPDPQNTIIPEDQDLVSAYYDLPDEEDAHVSPWLLRIVLSKEMLTDRKIGMNHIKNTIHDKFGGDLNVMASEDNSENLVLRIRSTLHGPRKVKAESMDIDAEAVHPDTVPDEDEDEDPDEAFMRLIEASLLSELSLGGIPAIRKVFMREPKIAVVDPDTGSYTTESEWVLDTDGVNLLSVMSHPDVDHTQTVSNDVVEMFDVLGIEAVRASLLNEVRSVISFDGAYVNYRHLAILCDTMTYRGFIMPITRHGINRVDTGPLMRCSFEETTEILLDAAIYAERDNLTGVSENIILGQTAQLGTGSFGLFLNHEALVNAAVPDNIEAPMQQTAGDYGAAAFGAPSFAPMTPGPYDMAKTPAYNTPMRETPRYGDAFRSPYVFATTSDDAIFSPGPSPRGGSDGPKLTAYATNRFSSSTGGGLFAVSPAYAPSPAYLPTSPGFVPTSPAYAAAGGYAPTSPGYSPSSPQYSPSSPQYSPSSPQYSPSSPQYSPSSPQYSPSSPQYSPSSPQYSPSSPQYSPSSPQYSPSSPQYSPSSPQYSPSSPQYSPSSPQYSPSSPQYSPSSPQYNPGAAPGANVNNVGYSPASPAYSPSSPVYTNSPAYVPSPRNNADEAYSPSSE